MTTVSTKHNPSHHGDPLLSVKGAKGTILDDMEIIRKYCLQEKNKISSNTHNVSLGNDNIYPLNTTKQSDYGNPSMADIEPIQTRQSRSRYMNSKHFDLGFDAPPMLTEKQATMMAPSRADLLAQPRNHMIGGPNNSNASNLFSNPDDRRDWAKDCKSTNQHVYKAPPGDMRDPFNKEIMKQLRDHHFNFGEEKPQYDTHYNKSYPEHPLNARADQVKAPPTAVQLGSLDYEWGKDLKTTHRDTYTAPVRVDDSLDRFVKAQPIVMGDNPREMMTTYKNSYKNIGYLDCAQLTDEQLLLLGVTREQLIPRKVTLPFLSKEIRRMMEAQQSYSMQ